MAAHGRLTVAAIIVAAGDGTRLGGGIPKAFCEVAGRSLLDYAQERFGAHDSVRDVIVVGPPDHLDRARQLAPGAIVVGGGATRGDSVLCGLAVLADDVDAVLVHDVARPFVPAAVISRVVGALAAGADAVIPVVAPSDTIKGVEAGLVTKTFPRSDLRAAQTPQGFRRTVLLTAYQHAAADVEGHVGYTRATDDAGLVEALDVPVCVVDGADESFKITRPWDLRVAEAVAADLMLP
jgi:2-C-methyl-D-erythritol 4-phosphate cytidylyltransferase